MLHILPLAFSPLPRGLPNSGELPEPRSSSSAQDGSWAILGVDSYSVSRSFDTWSRSDVYVRMKVSNGWTFTSDVLWNKESSDRRYYAYVPTGSRVTIELWDRDEVINDDKIGSMQIVAAGSYGTRTLAHQLGDEATAAVTLYTGQRAVLDAAEALNFAGVFVEYLPDQPWYLPGAAVAEYSLARVPNDGIEDHIAFAKAGSVFPEPLHGIWWMDQRGEHLKDYPDGPPNDPEYRQECNAAADEVLVAFGETGWDETGETGHGCVVGQHIYAGGPLRGHWTWLDSTGRGESSDWASSALNVPNTQFCFEDAERTRVTIPRVWEAFWGLKFPDWVMQLQMVKKPWGWDRVTLLGPGGIGGTCHYPVWQIVDGLGQRTEHYEAYLRFANLQSPVGQASSSFDFPLNRGNGTTLVARLQPR